MGYSPPLEGRSTLFLGRTVVLTDNVNVFNANSDNKPFNSTLPEQPVQVLAMRKS